MKARMSDRVRLPDGEVTTLADLHAQGRLVLSHSNAVTFSGRGKARRAYFAGVGDFVVEISQADYEANGEPV